MKRFTKPLATPSVRVQIVPPTQEATTRLRIYPDEYLPGHAHLEILVGSGRIDIAVSPEAARSLSDALLQAAAEQPGPTQAGVA